LLHCLQVYQTDGIFMPEKIYETFYCQKHLILIIEIFL